MRMDDDNHSCHVSLNLNKQDIIHHCITLIITRKFPFGLNSLAFLFTEKFMADPALHGPSIAVLLLFS